MTSGNTSLKKTFYAFVLVSAMSSQAWGQADQYKRNNTTSQEKVAAPGQPAPSGSAPAAQKPSEKVDVTDLEQKYWAPKDTDFSVVQNRTYAKEGKTAISLMYGQYVNDAFSDGKGLGLSANYFISERYGIELQYMQSDMENNKLTGRLISDHGALPDHNKVDTFYGVSFNWIPIYAKASVMGQRIIYFDLAISPGLGMTNYEQQIISGANSVTTKSDSAMTYTLDITQFFFISQYIALRVDLKNRWWKGDVLDGLTGEKKGSENESNTLFLFGATFYF